MRAIPFFLLVSGVWKRSGCCSLFLLEYGATLFVIGDDAGKRLKLAVFLGGQRDLADGVRSGVVQDVAFHLAGTFIGGKAEVKLNR